MHTNLLTMVSYTRCAVRETLLNAFNPCPVGTIA